MPLRKKASRDKKKRHHDKDHSPRVEHVDLDGMSSHPLPEHMDF